MGYDRNLLAQGMLPLVEEVMDAKLKEMDFDKFIDAQLEKLMDKESNLVVLQAPGGKPKKMVTHKQFKQLLNVIALPGLNVLLTGGAGLSKSTAVMQAAEALGLEFGSISFSNQTTKTDLLGFIDAHGVYRKSGFIDAFENGKIFLADEMDACSPNVLVLLNSAISNGIIETPDNKVIKAHDKFRFVATANTNLRGATSGFTARNRLDAATIDRFVVIEWELDKKLEKVLTNNDGWLAIVRKARDIAEKKLQDIEITPRSSYMGAKLIQAGIPVEQVIKMTITRSIGKDQEKLILRGITTSMKESAEKGNPVEPVKTKAKKEEVPEKSDWTEVKKDEAPDFAALL